MDSNALPWFTHHRCLTTVGKHIACCCWMASIGPWCKPAEWRKEGAKRLRQTTTRANLKRATKIQKSARLQTCDFPFPQVRLLYASSNFMSDLNLLNVITNMVLWLFIDSLFILRCRHANFCGWKVANVSRTAASENKSDEYIEDGSCCWPKARFAPTHGA